jgi:hypothetical protein
LKNRPDGGVVSGRCGTDQHAANSKGVDGPVKPGHDVVVLITGTGFSNSLW